MATLTLNLPQTLRLHCTSDSRLHLDAGVLNQSLRLGGNLLCKLTGRGDDEGADVVGGCARAMAGEVALGEFWIGLDDS